MCGSSLSKYNLWLGFDLNIIGVIFACYELNRIILEGFLLKNSLASSNCLTASYFSSYGTFPSNPDTLSDLLFCMSDKLLSLRSGGSTWSRSRYEMRSASD